MATQATSVEDVAKAKREAEKTAAESKATAINASRTGVGTRLSVGSTRGKGTQVITFEEFDYTKPETLPKSIDEFAKVSGAKDESELLSYLIDGYNAQSYANASDPIGEYAESSWDAETVKQFKGVVKNYMGAVKGAMSLEDVVNLIKPGIVAALAAAK